MTPLQRNRSVQSRKVYEQLVDAQSDVELLKIKIEKLQAEIERLRFGDANEQWSRGWTRTDFISEIELLRAEIERLQAESEAFRGKLAEQCGQTLVARAEIERLRAALQEIAKHRNGEDDGLDYLATLAARALEPKP
jgi:uncharacterized small protein (DUF1192 family)